MPSSEPFRFDHPDFFVAGAVGEPGQSCLLPPGRPGRRRRHRCGARSSRSPPSREHLDELLSTSRRASPTRSARRAARAGRAELDASAASRVGYDEADRPHRVVARGVARRRRGRGAEASRAEDAVARCAITRGTGGVAHRHRRGTASPAVGRCCRFCGQPMDPDGPHLPAIERHHEAMTFPTDARARPPRRRRAIELLGRMPWSSNATFLVDVVASRRRRRRRRRARSTSRSGASARCGTSPPGLYRREVAAFELVRGARLGHRARDRAARRPARARARCSGSSTPTSSSTTSRCSTRRRAVLTPAPAHLLLRPARQQHRPQERPLPARRRRPHLGDRQRRSLPRRVQAPHRHLGLRRRAASRRRRCSTTSSCLRRRRPRRRARDLLDPFERDALAAPAPRRCWHEGVFPHDPTGRRYPWPLV